jgi:hypothetical protein
MLGGRRERETEETKQVKMEIKHIYERRIERRNAGNSRKKEKENIETK